VKCFCAADDDRKTEQQKKEGGLLSSIIGWLPKRPTQAHLGEENTLVYDPVKKRWVSKVGLLLMNSRRCV
jgi:hypothetical protein